MKTQELQIVSFEQAERLREAGFDWNTTDFYHESGDKLDNYPNPQDFNEYDCMLSAPSVPLALKWIRDVKGILADVMYCEHDDWFVSYKYHSEPQYRYDRYKQVKGYATYEMAESALLDALLTLLEEGYGNETL